MSYDDNVALNLKSQILAAHAELNDGKTDVDDIKVILSITLECIRIMETYTKLSGGDKQNMVKQVVLDICPYDYIDSIIEFLVDNCLYANQTDRKLRFRFPKQITNMFKCFKRRQK